MAPLKLAYGVVCLYWDRFNDKVGPVTNRVIGGIKEGCVIITHNDTSTKRTERGVVKLNQTGGGGCMGLYLRFY